MVGIAKLLNERGIRSPRRAVACFVRRKPAGSREQLRGSLIIYIL
jgi:hypothetical protein